MKERSVGNTLLKADKLAMNFNPIPTNLKHMSDCSTTAHLIIINKLFITDVEEMMRESF